MIEHLPFLVAFESMDMDPSVVAVAPDSPDTAGIDSVAFGRGTGAVGCGILTSGRGTGAAGRLAARTLPTTLPSVKIRPSVAPVARNRPTSPPAVGTYSLALSPARPCPVASPPA